MEEKQIAELKMQNECRAEARKVAEEIGAAGSSRRWAEGIEIWGRGEWRGRETAPQHDFTRYVKVAFFRGTSLRPVPPGPSKDKNTRYLDIREDDDLDEAQMVTWVKQAAALPGWVP